MLEKCLFCNCGKVFESVCAEVEKLYRPTAKSKLKTKFFKYVFQRFSPPFQRIYTSEEIFCRTAISAEHRSVAIPVYSISNELETPNLEVSFRYLHLFTSYNKKCGNNPEETYETYYALLYTYGYRGSSIT